jgi:glycosyl transferase family 25
MPTFDAIMTKFGAVVRRGLPSLRNVVLSRLGIWPVSTLSAHWIADVPTYCISLTRATGRRRLMAAQVRAMELRHLEFVDAVDARTLSMEALRESGTYDSDTCRKYHTRDLTINEIACSLSHAAAYRLVVERGHPWALILEDDALFRTRRLSRLQRESIPQDTDIVFLNAFLDRRPPLDPIGQHLYRDTSYNGSAAAYMVSLDAARHLLAPAFPVVHAALWPFPAGTCPPVWIHAPVSSAGGRSQHDRSDRVSGGGHQWIDRVFSHLVHPVGVNGWQ